MRLEENDSITDNSTETEFRLHQRFSSKIRKRDTMKPKNAFTLVLGSLAAPAAFPTQGHGNAARRKLRLWPVFESHAGRNGQEHTSSRPVKETCTEYVRISGFNGLGQIGILRMNKGGSTMISKSAWAVTRALIARSLRRRTPRRNVMNRVHTGLLGIPLLLTLAPTAPATTWYVNGIDGNNGNDCKSPATACKTIGHTISQATSGDSIVVAAGTYTENITISMSLNVIGSSA